MKYLLFFNCIKSVLKVLKTRLNQVIIIILFYVNEILKIRNPDNKKAENYITNEVAEIHNSVDYSSKLWKKKKDEEYFKFIIKEMSKKLVSKSVISFVYYCIYTDFKVGRYRQRFNEYVNREIIKLYDLKAVFEVQSGNNIRAVDKKGNAFLNAQNLWCENNPSYLKNHTLSYNFK